MSKIIIVYHSGYGHTKKLAEAILTGVNMNGNIGKLISTSEVQEETWTSLATANAIIFGSPTYMGNVSAEFKKFADASSRAFANFEWKDKIAGGFTNSSCLNGDKLATLQYMWTLSQQHGMIWVGTALMGANKKSSTRNDINYLGSFAGLMDNLLAMLLLKKELFQEI